MLSSRRNFIKKTLTVASAGFIIPRTLKGAGLDDAFGLNNLEDAIHALTGAIERPNSNKILIKVSKVAENGAIVPIIVSSSLPKVRSIAVFAEKNPIPLVAHFELTEGTKATVQTRIKMAETSDVVVVVNADGHFYTARQPVEVTIGGCGS